MLKNLSPRFKTTWKKLQNKTLFFSCLRFSIKNSRIYGIKAPIFKKKEVKRRKESLLKKMVIEDNNWINKIHSALILFLSLSLIVLYPLDLSISIIDDYNTNGFDYFIMMIYFFVYLSSALRFFKPFKTKDSVIEREPAEIAKEYLKGWFAIDILLSLPYYYFLIDQPIDRRKLALIPLILALMNFTFNNSRSSNCIISKLASIITNSRSRSFIRSILFALFIIHVCSCIWIYLLQTESDNNWYHKYVSINNQILLVGRQSI